MKCIATKRILTLLATVLTLLGCDRVFAQPKEAVKTGVPVFPSLYYEVPLSASTSVELGLSYDLFFRKIPTSAPRATAYSVVFEGKKHLMDFFVDGVYLGGWAKYSHRAYDFVQTFPIVQSNRIRYDNVGVGASAGYVQPLGDRYLVEVFTGFGVHLARRENLPLGLAAIPNPYDFITGRFGIKIGLNLDAGEAPLTPTEIRQIEP